MSDIPIEIRTMTGVKRCKHCGHRPLWIMAKRIRPVRYGKPFLGHLEHFCKDQEFYLHGAWQETINEWNKENLA